MSEKQAITEEQGIHKEWYVQAKTQTVDTLVDFVRHLTEDYQHDYGTICHAVAAAALAAAWAVERSPTGGISGFQSGVIMWEFIAEWQHLRGTPLRLVQFENMLYPQYADQFCTISPDTAKWLREEAQKHLAADPSHMAESVRAHMEVVAKGAIPFGYRVSEW